MAIIKEGNTYRVSVDRVIKGIKVRFKKEGFKSEMEAEVYEMEEIQRRVLKAKKKELLDKQRRELEALESRNKPIERTLSDAVESYMMTISHLEETTIDQYYDRINKYIFGNKENIIQVTNRKISIFFENPLRKETLIKDISTNDLQVWKNELINIDGELVGSLTKKRIIKIMLDILKNEADDYNNVLANINQNNFKAPRKEIREMRKKSKIVINEKQFDLMLSNIDEMEKEGLLDKLLLETYWLTSARRNEVIGLRVCDIKDGFIEFRGSVRNSRKRGTMIPSRMKTESSYRVIEVPTRLTENLRYYARNVYGIIDCNQSEKYLFSLTDGDSPISPNSVSRRVSKYAYLARKIDGNIEIPTIKDLRSSSINSYFQQIFKQSEGGFQDYDNVITLAAKRMGHSNTDTTKKYYLEALSAFEEQKNHKTTKKLIDKIDSNFNYRSTAQAMMLTTSIPHMNHI